MDNVLYTMTTPQLCQNINMVRRSIVASSWGKTKKKRAHATSYKSWFVSVPRRLFRLLFPDKKTDPCWIRQCRAESRSWEKPRGGRRAASFPFRPPPPHLRPALPPPPTPPALKKTLSNKRLSRAAPRRHHSGPWFLWFRRY